MDSLSLGLPEIPPPILPRVCWPIDSLLRLGRPLLSTAKSPWQRPSRCGARLSLQMDPHLVPLLENPSTLRPSALPHRLAPTRLPLYFSGEKLLTKNLTDPLRPLPGRTSLFASFPSTSYWATFTQSLRDKSSAYNPKRLKLALMGRSPRNDNKT